MPRKCTFFIVIIELFRIWGSFNYEYIRFEYNLHHNVYCIVRYKNLAILRAQIPLIINNSVFSILICVI